MRLVEGIFGKIHHVFIDLSRRFLIDAPGDTAGYPFLLVSVYKIGPLLLHHRLLFLAHGTADKIASSHGIASQVSHDLHHLLLIHDTAVGRCQNRLQLRAGVDHRIMIIFPLNILGNKFHGPRPVQRDPGYNILQIPGTKLLHKALHPPAFQLENAVCPAGADGGQHLGIIVVNMIYINMLSLDRRYKFHGVMDHRQRPQSQEIHFQKTQLFQGRHGKLGGYGTVAASGKRHKFIGGLRTDHHSRRMHGGVSGKPLQPFAHVNEPVHLFILPVQLAKLRIFFQRQINGNIQLSRYHLGNGIHKSIGKIHHTSHVTDHTLCRQRTERNNLHHLVRAVFAAHIINDLLPAVKAEVNVDIRHGHPLRIQETFKQQTVPYGIDVGNLQAVGHNAARRGPPPRSHRNPVAASIINKIPYNKEVIHIPHGAYNTQLIVKALSQGLPRVSRRQAAVPVSLFQALVTQTV